MCEVKYVYAIRTEVGECVATPAIIFIFLPTSSMLPAAEARPAARFRVEKRAAPNERF